MAQIGRISGTLLNDNLIRLGEDLSFKNQHNSPALLFLEVNTNKVLINQVSGSSELGVNGTTKTTNLIVDTQATLDGIVLSTNIFTTTVGSINISPNQVNPLVLMDQMQAADINIKDNVIKNSATNGSIELNPMGSGWVDIQSNATINGNLIVTGNMNISGNLRHTNDIIVGNNVLEDTVTIDPDFSQSIIPGTDNTYDLGKSNKRWRQVWSPEITYISNLTYNSLTVSDQLQIDGPTATINSLQSNDDVLLSPPTGLTKVESFNFVGDVITNTSANTAFTLASCGIGYTRFLDTNALLIPAGTNSQQPASAETGDTRWNTEEGYLECFDGTVWNSAVGASGGVSQNAMEDLSNIYILVLG